MTRPRRILLLGETLGAYRTQHLLRILAAHGYRVTQVAASWYADGRTGLIASIRWRALLWLEAMMKVWFADLIMLPAMNGRMFPLARRLRTISRRPVVVDLYVSLYDTLVKDRKLVREGSREARRLRKLDREIIETADHLIHLTRFELEHIARTVGATVDWGRTSIVPLAVDARIPAQRSRETGAPLRVCWWGTYIPLHGLDKLLRAFRILQDRGVPFEADLLGPDSPDAASSIQLASELGLGDAVRFHRDKTFDNGALEPFLREHCDLALGIFGDSQKAKSVVANKVLDAMAMRLPVLTMQSPALEEFFTDELFTCEPTPDGIAGAIISLSTAPGAAEERAGKGFDAWRSTFSPDVYERSLVQILDQIFREHTRQES